eukprot:TRINITY_DN5960_c0_g1_i2.p1 TRINITY_DN5960_c0_g1~~TRINITY_DN5960_c0_g1_i2.p1  ORF type:complete len:361 (+),score=69.97 TRINITY_DN5960_c0_g1_i2:189-1271(+)
MLRASGIARLLRFHNGDVALAQKAYSEFLTWRVQENIEVLRTGIMDLSFDEFISWLDTVRSPFAPPACPMLGEHPDGHIVVYAQPGSFKAVEFTKQRPACHTMDTDLCIMYICAEYILKQLEDRSYSRQKMLYTIKVIDMKNLGKERLPILVPEIRSFAKANIPGLMKRYCEHDILIAAMNAPFVFRMVWAFASGLISKRQQDRVRVFSDATSKDAQEILLSLLPLSQWPPSLGGSRTVVPNVLPSAHEDAERVKAWMALTSPKVVRGVGSTVLLGSKGSTAKAAPTPEAAAAPTPSTAASETAAATPAAAAAAATSASPLASAEAPVPVATPIESPEPDGSAVIAPSGGWFCCASPVAQ